MDTLEGLYDDVLNFLTIVTCSCIHYSVCVISVKNRMEEPQHLFLIRRVYFFVEILTPNLPGSPTFPERHHRSNWIIYKKIHYPTPTETIVPCWVCVFMEYFYLVYLLYLHHHLQHIYDLLHLNNTPYSPPRRIHIQLFYIYMYACELIRLISLNRTVWTTAVKQCLSGIIPVSLSPVSP